MYEETIYLNFELPFLEIILYLINIAGNISGLISQVKTHESVFYLAKVRWGGEISRALRNPFGKQGISVLI